MAPTAPGKSEDLVKSWIHKGTPVIILSSGIMHFIYAWTGKLTVVGIWAPVNESVWEHQKLAFLPILLWWIFVYLRLHKKQALLPEKWFFSCAVAELVCPVFIIAFYYIKTGAFGIHSLLLDMISLILGVIIAHSAALHIYRYAQLNRRYLYIAVLMLALMMFALILLTFDPPKVPLFMDSLTGGYGI
ncbi:MAG TPA: hypothetical protein DIT32_04095 [Peptococcaceae bacterium]|nr:hypothetical protein [Peptococcaceae bacterium]